MATALKLEAIEQAALDLQPSARMELTHRLVRSFTDLAGSQIEGLWLDEAERRDAEMESGEVEGLPGEDVFRRLYERYRR